MRLSSRLLLMKYAAKSAVLRRRPGLYWRLRRMAYGLYEPEMALLPSFADPARPAFDIGANFGLWTHSLLPHFAAVQAFEPIPRLAAVLRQGYRGAPVTVHETALSEVSGHTILRMPVANLGRSTVESENDLALIRDRSQKIAQLEVTTRRLDDMDLPDPAFIKIDAEGHELAILKGAARTIARARPVMMLEMEKVYAPSADSGIRNFFSALNYASLRLPGSRNMLFLPGARL
jgi:FkbM family methyltransferase